MAKTLKTSGDYTIKAGAGSAGSNTIRLDAQTVRIPGNLSIDGTQTVINSTTLTVEDQFIELNRNNSTAGTEDSGIFFNQGSSNHALLYYDAGNSEFQLGTTTQDAAANTITNITLGQLKVATTPTDGNHATSKSYVDGVISGGGFTIFFTGDDSSVIQASPGATVDIAGGSNISTVATEEPDTITISLDQNLNNINSISNGSTSGDLQLTANSTGSIIIDNILTFAGTASDPATGTTTKLYHKAVGGGVSGVYFKNPAGVVGELISKAKATALAIALG
jgi:hypothetical protein